MNLDIFMIYLVVWAARQPPLPLRLEHCCVPAARFKHSFKGVNTLKRGAHWGSFLQRFQHLFQIDYSAIQSGTCLHM